MYVLSFPQYAVDQLFEGGLVEVGTDEQLLAGSGSECDRLPTVDNRNRHPKLHLALGIADRTDDAGDDRADAVLAGENRFQNVTKSINDAVLDLEFALYFSKLHSARFS
jgi:hypothetical protein